MKKNYVSNEEITPRLFQNNFFEFFSKINWKVPMIVYTPVVLVFLFIGIRGMYQHGPSLWLVPVIFVLAYALWTFVEYFMHRFVFHFTPHGELLERIHFIFHGVHHDYPNDPKRLVMPLAVSIPLAFLFYYLFKWTIPNQGIRDVAFAGFVTGYIIYDTVHYALHHFNFKGNGWAELKRHHMLHHYMDEHKGFGVSWEFWDMVFKTGFPQKRSKSKEQQPVNS